MYYMTLPLLYQRVILRAYPQTRYVDGRPEGYGSGSPFAMGLSGLATGNNAPLVKDFTLTGAWSEPKIDEYTQGKIPDSTILLGIALRAAIDKMTHLDSFAWSLDSKPTKSIYQGLAARSSLTSLNLRFPQNRSPRPIIVIPPMPNLRCLRLSNIDPLCYPDDVSTLILHAKKLQDLRIHWSPRMRQEAESSITLRSIFGKCLEAGYKVPVKHLGLQNFYGPNTGDLETIFDSALTMSMDFLDVFGGTYSSPTTFWVDDTWRHIPNAEYFKSFKNFKKCRISETSPQHAKILSSFTGMHELYIVGSATSVSRTDWVVNTPSSDSTTPTTSVSTPGSGKMHEKESASLCKLYIRALTTFHGDTLTKLLLSDRWPLSGSQMSEIVSRCPNLEQLGFALDKNAQGALTLLSPFFVKLAAMRILSNEYSHLILEDSGVIGLINGSGPGEVRWKCHNSVTRWCGVESHVFKVHPAVQELDEQGNVEWHNPVTLGSLDDVKDYEIWKLDVLEL
jgi:hypothetical protein